MKSEEEAKEEIETLSLLSLSLFLFLTVSFATNFCISVSISRIFMGACVCYSDFIVMKRGGERDC